MAEPSGIAALGIDLKILIAQLVNFLLLYFLLSKFAFGPLGKILEERRKRVEESEKRAQEIEQEKISLDETVKKTMADAKREAQEIISRGQESIKKETALAKKNTEERAATLLMATKKEIDAMKKSTKQELAREIGLLVVKATEKVVQKNINDREKDAITASTIKEIKNDH